jgi:hypothetical protein
MINETVMMRQSQFCLMVRSLFAWDNVIRMYGQDGFDRPSADARARIAVKEAR